MGDWSEATAISLPGLRRLLCWLKNSAETTRPIVIRGISFEQPLEKGNFKVVLALNLVACTGRWMNRNLQALMNR